MATAVATIEPKVPVQSGAKLAAMIPTDVDQAYRLSKAIAGSGMAPKAYGTDPNKILVGILAGMEVGLTPFAALQSIAVIGNNPAIWGDGALALVQASGLLEDMEETCDGNAAVCRLNRKGRPTPIIGKFDMDKAKKAGLAGKSGPWTQYPTRMLQMRARAFALRDGFADVLKGLRIAEEIRDYGNLDGGTLDAQPITAAALLEQAAPQPSEAGSEVTGEAAGSPQPEAEPEALPNADMGEVTTLDSAKAEIDAATTVPDVNSRLSALRPLLSDDDGDELVRYGGDRIGELQGNA